MKFSGIDLSFDNPIYGYKTKIIFPFTFNENGNNTVSVFDYGFDYDKVECSCKLIFTDEYYYRVFNSIYTKTNDPDQTGRSDLLKMTDCNAFGFYPFGFFVSEPQGGYSVYMKDVVTHDKQDFLGKIWSVDFSLVWDLSVDTRTFTPISPFTHDGDFSLAGITGLPYPEDGFEKEKDFDQKIYYNFGGNVYGLDISNKKYDQTTSSFLLRLTNSQLNSLMQSIIINFRGSPIPYSCPSTYSPFGIEKTEWAVENTSGFLQIIDKNIIINHIGCNQFDISFKVCQI